MYANVFLSILGMQLVFNEVYFSEIPAPDCDGTNGPSGLTYCVQSSSYPNPQAAICLPKYKIRVSTPRHLTCKWKDAKYCWHLCSTTPSHGGLSTCECDPKSTWQGMSDDINCYFPSGNYFWVSACLAKLKKCPSIEEMKKKFLKWDLIAGEMYDYGRLWIKAVKLCIQESLVHILYPQVFNDCERIESKIESATEACYMKPNNEHRFCDLSWHDMYQTFNDYSFLPRHYKTFHAKIVKCAWTPVIPPWAKLLVFYLENKTGKDIDKDILATETAKALSLSFKWNEAKVTHKAVAPDIFNKKSTSIPIRVYLYSEAENSEQIERIVFGLKTYLANREKLELFLSDDTRIGVISVMSCSDPQCLTYELFPFKTDDPSCKSKGGNCQNENTPCQRGHYTRDHCYEDSKHKCCVKFLDKSSCKAAGGICQDKRKQCLTGSYIFGHCGSESHIKKCCLSKYRDQDTGDCPGLPIMSRDTWGASDPAYSVINMTLPVKISFIHHTHKDQCEGTESCSGRLRGIQRYQIGNEYSDIGYNFLIGDRGQIFEGRGWYRLGGHTFDYNQKSLAISFIGNFVEKLPTKQSLDAAHKLLKCAMSRKVLSPKYRLYGHYDVTRKDSVCPGRALYDEVRTWPHYEINADGDGPCLKTGGQCLPNYHLCKGEYKKKLCEGNQKTRLCCVPTT